MELTLENLKLLLSKSSSLGEAALELDLDKSLVEQGVDSLDILDYLLQIEEKFGVSIPDEDIDKVSSFHKMLEYVQDKMPE